MRKATVILVMCVLIWVSAGFIKPAFCHPAEVRDVVFMRFISSTHLNITVWHNIEDSLHYVDTIEVTWGTNITSLTIDPEPLAPDGTFTVDYNMGPVSGTLTITVRARCTITGYSGSTSWTETIPEATPNPSPSLSPTPSPTASPTSTSTSGPIPTVSPSLSPSPTEPPSPSPTTKESPSPAPSPTSNQTFEPTQSPEPDPNPFPTTLAIGIVVAVAVISVGLLVYFKKLRE